MPTSTVIFMIISHTSIFRNVAHIIVKVKYYIFIFRFNDSLLVRTIYSITINVNSKSTDQTIKISAIFRDYVTPASDRNVM